MTKKELKKFIKEHSFLMWDVKNPTEVSTEAIVERVLNYGDFDDVKELFNILSIEKVAQIFNKQLKQKRNNYRDEVINYFKMYFKKYA